MRDISFGLGQRVIRCLCRRIGTIPVSRLSPVSDCGLPLGDSSRLEMRLVRCRCELRGVLQPLSRIEKDIAPNVIARIKVNGPGLLTHKLAKPARTDREWHQRPCQDDGKCKLKGRKNVLETAIH
jgi:hypothetical protein